MFYSYPHLSFLPLLLLMRWICALVKYYNIFINRWHVSIDRTSADNAISSSVSSLERSDNYALFRLASQSIIGSVVHYVEHWEIFFFFLRTTVVADVCNIHSVKHVCIRFDVAITVLRLIGYPANPTCRFPSMKHYVCLSDRTRIVCAHVIFWSLVTWHYVR